MKVLPYLQAHNTLSEEFSDLTYEVEREEFPGGLILLERGRSHFPFHS